MSVVEDPLPVGLTFISASATQGTCAAGVACVIGTLNVNQTVTITVVAQVNADVAQGTVITNTARISGAVAEPPFGLPNEAQHSTLIESRATLAMSKMDLFDPVTPGGPLFYRIAVTNSGPSAAASLVVTDLLPDGVVFQSASLGCSHDGSASGGVLTCTVVSLGINQTAIFEVTAVAPVTAISGTVLINTAAATADNASPVNAAAQTTVQQAFGPPADLQVHKTGDAVALAGGQVAYTVVVTNSGPAIATGVDLKDVLPAGVTLGSARAVTPSQGLCAPSPFGALCQFGNLALGQVVTVTLVGDVSSSLTAGQVLTNTAQVFGGNPDPNAANNVSTAQTTVSARADLSLVKTATPNPAVPGQSLTYLLTVANAGPSDAQAVVVTDTLPAGFTASSISSSQGSCTALPCTLGTVPAGGNATITIVGTVAATVTTSLVNLAGVTSSTADPNSTNNAASLTTPVSPAADLALALASTPTAIGGQTATVTATVTNLGPSAASGTVVTITLPPSTTFNAATLPAGWFAVDNGNGTVTLTTTNVITAGQVVNLPIAVNVAPGVEPGTSLQFGGDGGEQHPGSEYDEQQRQRRHVGGGLGRSGVKQDRAGDGHRGAADHLHDCSDEHGPSTAQSVDVKDVLPAGVTLASAATSQGACGAVVCQFGDLPVGGVVTVTIVGQVASDVNGTITNTATVFSDSLDPNAANNSASAPTAVSALANVSVTKVDLTDPVAPGGGILYQIVVANAGPSDAQNVVVTDTLDAKTSFSGASAGCVHDGSPTDGRVLCTVGTLAAGQSVAYLIAVNASQTSLDGDVLTNHVVVSTTTPDNGIGNKTDAVTTTVKGFGNNADVVVAKRTAATSVTAGQQITYTLTVTNAGPSAATNVRLLDLIPAGATVAAITVNNPDDASAVCALGGSCYLGTVYVTSTVGITVVLTVNADFAGTTLANAAQVSADQQDPNTSNNIAGATTPVTTAADLVIAKAALADPVLAGEIILYQIRITNTGPSAAQAVVVTDAVPAHTTFVGASDFCTQAGGVVTCAFGTLAAGATAAAFVQVRVAADVADPTLLTNVARVSSSDG